MMINFLWFLLFVQSDYKAYGFCEGGQIFVENAAAKNITISNTYAYKRDGDDGVAPCGRIIGYKNNSYQAYIYRAADFSVETECMLADSIFIEKIGLNQFEFYRTSRNHNHLFVLFAPFDHGADIYTHIHIDQLPSFRKLMSKVYISKD